jgi:hypothetical protein
MTEDCGRTKAPVGTISKEWINQVEAHQNKKLVRIGKFDLLYLQEMVGILSENALGDIELLMMADNVMVDGAKAGLLVAKFEDEYVALAGLADGRIEPNRNP